MIIVPLTDNQMSGIWTEVVQAALARGVACSPKDCRIRIDHERHGKDVRPSPEGRPKGDGFQPGVERSGSSDTSPSRFSRPEGAAESLRLGGFRTQQVASLPGRATFHHLRFGAALLSPLLQSRPTCLENNLIVHEQNHRFADFARGKGKGGKRKMGGRMRTARGNDIA